MKRDPSFVSLAEVSPILFLPVEFLFIGVECAVQEGHVLSFLSVLTFFSLANVSLVCLPFSPDDITMVICPGIGNHSEKHYIRTFVDYAQKDGYRCAVLNHLGALPNIELTSPRMFTYGETKLTLVSFS